MKFCPACAARLAQTAWPRTCACGAVHYRNPVPVAVAVVPVCNEHAEIVGAVGVLRGERTGHGAGQWALPGGFQDWGEDATQAAARELLEETGIAMPAKDFQVVGTAMSSSGGQQLIFLRSPPITLEALAQARPQEEEAQAVGLLAPGAPLAFSSHQAQLEALLGATPPVGKAPAPRS